MKKHLVVMLQKKGHSYQKKYPFQRFGRNVIIKKQNLLVGGENGTY